MSDIPTVSWSESSPAGSDNIALGDNRIREMKTQIREIIDVDHDFPSSGQASDNGQHKKVTLQEQADLGTGATGVPILGAQTVSGKAELLFTDEDNNDIQLTSVGKIKLSSGRLENNVNLTARNNAGDGDVNLIKANTSDIPVLPDGSEMTTSGAPTTDAGIANKKYVDDSSSLGTAASKTVGTTYQATTDGFVVFVLEAQDGTSISHAEGYTDSNATPSTRMGACDVDGSQRPTYSSFMFPVKKSDYYKTILTTEAGTQCNPSMKFIPLGN